MDYLARNLEYNQNAYKTCPIFFKFYTHQLCQISFNKNISNFSAIIFRPSLFK